jgi:hypothetical protein
MYLGVKNAAPIANARKMKTVLLKNSSPFLFYAGRGFLLTAGVIFPGTRT